MKLRSFWMIAFLVILFFGVAFVSRWMVGDSTMKTASHDDGLNPVQAGFLDGSTIDADEEPPFNDVEPVVAPAPKAKWKKKRHKKMRMASAKTYTAPESTATTMSTTITESHDANVAVSMGVDAGSKHVLPVLLIRFALSENLVVGFNGSYIKDRLVGPQTEIAGGGVSVANYFSEAFRGFSLQSGLNIYDVTASQGGTVSKSTPIVYWVAAGWDGYLAKNLSYGFAAGLQIIDNQSTPLGLIEYDGAWPIVKATIGYSF